MTAANQFCRRILVVEDDGLLAMYISDLLDELGHYVVGPTGTVEDALAKIASEAIDLALLDVNLGNGKTSYPVAEMLTRRGVPFAFVTGYGAAGLIDNYRHRPVLSKPVDQALLSETLRKLAPTVDG